MDLVFAPSQIETWSIDRLRPYARNAKIHGTDQVAKIAASMAKFGWTVPCMVADDGELIAGHGRVLAASMLGLKDVPVIRLSHLDEAERRAYRIADNKLTELGEWDEAMLRDEIAGLLAEDFDLSLLGITDEDLDALLGDPDQVDGGAVEGEDDIPEPPITPVSLAGASSCSNDKDMLTPWSGARDAVPPTQAGPTIARLGRGGSASLGEFALAEGDVGDPA